MSWATQIERLKREGEMEAGVYKLADEIIDKNVLVADVMKIVEESEAGRPTWNEEWEGAREAKKKK